MKVEDEEIFGPVLTVNAYDDFDDAVARCADSRYGLQGGSSHRIYAAPSVRSRTGRSAG
jgi:acyl-CoA reductase-like NAD-dependent aldehyde dehydrogenase